MSERSQEVAWNQATLESITKMVRSSLLRGYAGGLIRQDGPPPATARRNTRGGTAS